MRFWILLLLGILLSSIGLIAAHNNTHQLSSVTIRNKTFFVVLAKTQQQQADGLSVMHRLPQNQGMLFVFQKPDYYTFWMKDMKFPIDIIFIHNDKIVTIYTNVAKPIAHTPDALLPTYKSMSLADIVLEINAGLSEKYHFAVGDIMTRKL